MKTSKTLLQVRDLDIVFGRGRNACHAVKGVSFDINQGEVLGLVGESGSGKTTIGNAIMRLIPVSGGEIFYCGQKINGKINRTLDKLLIQEMQMIFQNPLQSLNSRAKINDIVREGLQNIHPEMSREQQNHLIAQTLIDVGLRPEYGNRFPYSFSGGQIQRIGIARSVIMNPSFIIADEPVSALDLSVRSQILNLMMELRKKRNLTYLFISHDLSIMRLICDRIAVIKSGKIVEMAQAEQIYENPQHPYTKSLLSAIPIPNPDLERERKYFFCDEKEIFKE